MKGSTWLKNIVQSRVVNSAEANGNASGSASVGGTKARSESEAADDDQDWTEDTLD